MEKQPNAPSFTCTGCNYRFTLKSKTNTEAPSRCPYCGKTNTIRTVKHVLEEL